MVKVQSLKDSRFVVFLAIFTETIRTVSAWAFTETMLTAMQYVISL